MKRQRDFTLLHRIKNLYAPDKKVKKIIRNCHFEESPHGTLRRLATPQH